MIRFLFRVFILLLLAALGYGFFLLYQEKSDQDKKETIQNIQNTASSVARSTIKAFKKSGQKVKELVEGDDDSAREQDR